MRSRFANSGSQADRPFTKRLAIETLHPRLMLNADYRAIDGFGNNDSQPEWGTPDSQLLRLTSVQYADGISEPAGGSDGSGRPNPRAISNQVNAQSTEILNDRNLTNFLFQWGQFIDHDLGLTEESHPIDTFHVSIPADDPEMFPGGVIPLFRSRFDSSTGTDVENPRQQINQITSFIDASNVYRSDSVRADALREFIGGKLKTSAGDLMPYNADALPNAAPPPLAAEEYFLAGDVRANEQPGLTSMHTLFMREHNRLADELASSAEFAGEDVTDPEVDETLYQRARQVVSSLVQSITYNEFLPALLGPSGLPSYTGYDADVNPGIANIFSAALYRVGHTMLPEELLVLADGVPPEHIPLADAFFQPSIVAGAGIEPFLKGLSVQAAQEIDSKISGSVRNMLFDPPAQFDLAAINVQRGRDHGLPDYNQARQDFDLSSKARFRSITDDRQAARNLAKAYDGDINNIDVWQGAIAETHIPGGSVGELLQTVLVDQFTRTRTGDRYYFENVFEGEQLEVIQQTRLSDVIHRNTQLDDLQDEVFRDTDVLTYRMDSVAGNSVTLQAAGRYIQVVDTETGQVLESARRRDIDRIVVFGGAQADVVTLDGSLNRFRGELELHGGAGQDRLTLHGRNRRDVVIVDDGEAWFNRLHVTMGTFETIEIEARGGSDFVYAANSAVPVVVSGGSGHDVIFGSSHNDLLMGGGGRDTIFGLAGDDLMLGGSGRDVLLGGDGDDLLIGGRGWDFLIGGRGYDVKLQGQFPPLEELTGPIWEQALQQWSEDLSRRGFDV